MAAADLKPSALKADHEGPEWIDLIGIPNSGSQLMYRRFADMDDLFCLLETQLGLPTIQLDTIRASVIRVEENEIGGHNATLFLPENHLLNLGMNFRPPR